MDNLVRACLVAIALALALSAAHDLEWIGAPPAESARFRLLPIPQGRVILMQDVRTGETWKTNIKNPKKGIRIDSAPLADDTDERDEANEPANERPQGSDDS